MATSRQVSLVVRRFLWGQRNYSTGDIKTATTKVSRFAEIDARIEKALPPKIKALWNHPAGLKTIHFWAPSWKWCLVFAGMADYTRPAEKLSWRQSAALAATGIIWSRYSMVVVPKNWNLFSVNVFLALTGVMQLSRIFLYNKSLEKSKEDESPEPIMGPRIGDDKDDGVNFGPPVVTDPGEGFGPPGTGPPSTK
ncbi:mitochondrial pyruvate carrier 2-like [Amphiura filiformis]|uniref:mitochondrial pyruvate carrier 2-like n=1 Tax=Amphiura filiformis TaxID=82378 RepID=UPI003B22169A